MSKIKVFCLIIGAIIGVLLDGNTNVHAEGSITRGIHSGRYGVNRKVKIGVPNNTNFIGYFQIEGDFNCELKTPPTTITKAGDLPNKPSYYFGINGPGRHWDKDLQDFKDADNVEIDAGLEYDNRPDYKGWRAFISVHKMQTDYNIGSNTGIPWRGKQKAYNLKLRVDGNGVPHLRVAGSDVPGGAIEFAWNHNDKPHSAGEAVYPGKPRNAIGLKRVVANTRPAPDGKNATVQENWKLDGTRITCTITNNRVYSYWYGWPSDYSYNELLTNTSANTKIIQSETNYDTPFNGTGSYDLPTNSGGMSEVSRRIVDFPQLDGATGASWRFPQIIDYGRDPNSQGATQGTNTSRYTTETVRINLEKSIQARGKVNWSRIGNVP